MKKLVNLTGADLRVRLPSGEVLHVPAEKEPAGVENRTHLVDDLGDEGSSLPVYEPCIEVVGLPPPVEGTVYLVPPIVLQYTRDRADVVNPDENTAVFDPPGASSWVYTSFVRYGYRALRHLREGRADETARPITKSEK